MSGPYRETELSDGVKDAHRALASLQEELEAVDYYNQRADTTADGELEAVLLHNRDEEIEHAAMLLEYLRRRMPEFDENLKTYLFTTEPITGIEEGTESGADAGSGSLGIGALK